MSFKFCSSLEKALMHHPDPFLILTSRATTSEMVISLFLYCLTVQPVVAVEDFPVIWHMMNWNDFWFHSWPPSSCMHNLARIMSQIIISAMIHQLMKWPIISAAKSTSWCEQWFECLGFYWEHWNFWVDLLIFSPCIWCELHANTLQLSWCSCQYSSFYIFASEEQIN